MSWEQKRTSAAEATFGLSFAGVVVRPTLHRAEIRDKRLSFVQHAAHHEHEERAFEAEYKKIGVWKGRLGTAQERARVLQFWKDHGQQGARWLCRRLRRETHVDALDGVANILANIGEASLAPIVEELEREPSPEQSEAMLFALKWIRPSETHPSLDRLVRVLERLLRNGDPDLVERSCAATRVLDRRRAIELLEPVQLGTRDESLSEIIREELAGRAAS